jgi:tetratricopeptide (TPR) repeat protein
MPEESRQDRVARWQKRVEEAPSSAAAHFNLGLAHTERGRMLAAEKAYRRAVELDPDLVQAWVNLGGALLMKWDFQGCLEANQEALRRQDDMAIAHFNMGQAYLYLNEAEELVRCNRRVLELDPNHAAGHYFLAVGLLARGQVAEARAESDRALALGYQPRPEFLKSLDRAEKALDRTDTTSTPPEAKADGDAKEE